MATTGDFKMAVDNSSAGQPGAVYRVVATIEWQLGWTVAGAAGGGPLPAAFTSSPTLLRVAEIQALNQ
ncbi:MAG: hypothetical protein M3O70_17840 [Actinomycetota bacterium]|nr:hypothetical protein [Actinomycetota bacterium]